MHIASGLFTESETLSITRNLMSLTVRFPKGLYGITPEWDDTHALLAAITAAARGGMTALQWRRKNTPPQDQARRVVEHCRSLGVISIINDTPELARSLGADGVHMGRDDGDPAAARALLGPHALIGCSCYNEPERALKALQAGADYIAFGAVFPSSVKPNAPRAQLEIITQGAELVRQHSRAGQRATVVTIGGITPENARSVVAAGADSIAAITALFSTPDIQATAQRYTDCFTL